MGIVIVDHVSNCLVEQGEECIKRSGGSEVHDVLNRARVFERRAHQPIGLEERLEVSGNSTLNRKQGRGVSRC